MTAHPINLDTVRKILLLGPFGLGDLVRNLSIINVLKQGHPDLQIDIAYVQAGSEGMLKYNRNVNHAIQLHFKRFSPAHYVAYFLVSGWKDIARFNRRQYDLVISTSANPLRQFILRFTKARYKISIPHKGSDSLQENKVLEILDVRPKRKENIFNNAEYVRQESSTVVARALRTDRPNILINMFCADSPASTRDWDQWSDLIDRLGEYHGILVGRVPFDYKKHYPLDYSKVHDLINKTSFDELIAVINRSDVVITIDSFIFHAAYALNKKVIGLFGPVDPKTRIPPTVDDANIVTLFAKPPCAPCIVKEHINYCKNTVSPNVCMKSIGVDAVLDALKRFLPTA